MTRHTPDPTWKARVHHVGVRYVMAFGFRRTHHRLRVKLPVEVLFAEVPSTMTVTKDQPVLIRRNKVIKDSW